MPTGIYERKKQDLPPLVKCAADDCSRLQRSRGCQYCEAHYYRVRRNGTLALKPKLEKVPALPVEKIRWRRQPKAYVALTIPGHPLAGKTGHIYQHRFVFHETHGDGPFC